MDSINIDLLRRLYKIFSPSKHEERMSLFVQSQLVKIGINDFGVDNLHQIYRLKPNTRLLCAHMDQVSRKPISKVYTIGNFMFGDGNLGADDKNGIYIVLDLLERFRNESFIFSTGEEVGCNIDQLLEKYKNILKEIKYGIVFDRRNGSDIIGRHNDYCVKEFDEDLEEIGEEFNFKSGRGIFSDCDKIRDYISCANMSCGYYNPHSATEYTKIDELINARDFGVRILEKIDKKYDKPVVFTYYHKGVSHYGKSWRKENSYRNFVEEIEKGQSEQATIYGGDYWCEKCNNLFDEFELEKGKLCPYCKTPVFELDGLDINNEDLYICTLCDVTFSYSEIKNSEDDTPLCPFCGTVLEIYDAEDDSSSEYCFFCGRKTRYTNDKCEICGVEKM